MEEKKVNIKLKKKVVLAFSGGLDTSFCVLYLIQQGFDVVTLTVDTGGFSKKEIQNIKNQSKKTGAYKHYFIDGKKDLYQKIVSYIVKGNILRGGVYPLSAGPERLIIATTLVEIAKKEKITAVAHGSTGAGNDQIRFDVTIKVLAPELTIITPIRDLSIKREEEMDFLKKNNIPVSTVSKNYSVNKGMLGITIGGKETKGSWESPPQEVYEGLTPILKAPNEPGELIVSFYHGNPTHINSKKMSGVEIMEYLNVFGAKHGVGKDIHLGNTILGIKGRVAFIAPASLILIKSHKELEKLVLTKWQAFWKDTLADVYGNFLHEALYFDPVMRDIEALINSSQSKVTGDVKLQLFKGNIIIIGCKSPYSLMNPEVAVYGEHNILWSGEEVKGFSKIYGLQSILAKKATIIGDKYEKNKIH